VWSVSDGGCFQGYGRMTSAIRQETTKWPSPTGSTVFKGVFDVEWINRYTSCMRAIFTHSRTGISFRRVQHIKNSFNKNQSVIAGSDCQVCVFSNKITSTYLFLGNRSQISRAPSQSNGRGTARWTRKPPQSVCDV
jgi:hypothetical protein